MPPEITGVLAIEPPGRMSCFICFRMLSILINTDIAFFCSETVPYMLEIFTLVLKFSLFLMGWQFSKICNCVSLLSQLKMHFKFPLLIFLKFILAA